MKISKLFHWLYAILMLLPILVFIPNAFYYGFNEHAVAQEKTEQVPVYYQSNEVNTYEDLQINKVYSWLDNFVGTPQPQSYGYFNCKVLNGTYKDKEGLFYYQTSGTIIFFDGTYNNIANEPFDFLITSYANNISIIPSEILDKITECNTKYIKEYQPLTTNMSITDSMSYAWDSVWQNDLFSWSYGSFLTQPFIYIGNLFNLPVDNSLYYALSYWLDISIIWLVFDVIIYVPLLVHRWLDKGIIE